MLALRRLPALLLALGIVGTATVAAPAPAVTAADDNAPWTVPTPPPVCTAKQLKTGNVAGCLVRDYDDPQDDGWPSPPFPSDPADPNGVGVLPLDGWKFNGFQYNGSPALASWETQLAGNATTIGKVKPNQLKAFPDALVLFEGFLRDIQAGGYKVADAGTYSFRCTSSSRPSCAGLTRSSLSNHAWGLALDMNAGTNGNQVYSGIDGASACLTPIKTDMPHWVIQTAEKWGLYWGGYGWSACTTTSEQRTSVSRDAPHFEFEGTPEQARAIAAFNGSAVPDGCLQIAADSGALSVQCLQAGDTPAAGSRVVIDTKAPAGATAALVNIAMTGAATGGYVTAETCAAVGSGPRATATGNVAKGQTAANLAVVPLDANGTFCLYRSQALHTIVDVEGFFVPPAAGADAALFTPADPRRLLDTRATGWCDPSGACTPGAPPAGTEVVVTAPDVPATATAVLADLAVTQPTGDGYLAADACTALTPGPQAHANGNYAKGETIANLAVVPVDQVAAGPQFCVYGTAALHHVVDLQGWFAPASKSPAGLGFTALPTQRLVDTRSCTVDVTSGAATCQRITDAGAVVRIHAPAGAKAVLVNLALTEATADGFATAQACSTLQPTESNGNVARGGTVSNLAVVGVDPDGTFCVRVSQPMQVVVDLEGMFTDTGGSRFVAVAPVRRSDTRPAA